MKPKPGSNLAIGLGVAGAVIGVLASPKFPSVRPSLVMLAGFTIGAQIGGLIYRLQQLKWPKPKPSSPRQPHHLREDLRDSYYSDLVMKKIMQAYHVEDAAETDGSAEDCAEQALDESEPSDDPFSWANDLRGLGRSEDTAGGKDRPSAR